MIGIGRFAVVCLGIVIGALVAAGPAHAQAGKCASTKLKATCKKAACKAALEAKQAQIGGTIDPLKLAKCEAAFNKAFGKAESKGGCATTGDAGTMEGKVDAYVADLASELDVLTGTNPNKCEAAKIRAAAKKTKCKCALEAKQAAKGGVIDPAKTAKCEDKFATAYAKNETKGGCNTTGDAAAIETKVDAFVADADTELQPASTTTTTVAGTTTTTAGGGTTTTTVPSGGVELQGALTATPGRFNYNLMVGLPGANAACNTNFPGTHACTYAELQTAEAAGDLVGLTDTGSNTVTTFWAIDNSQPPLQQCQDDVSSFLNWEYATAHTASRGQKVALNNGTGALGALQSSLQCNFSTAWVGCCI